MIQVVGGLPVVEDLITVLYRRKEGGDEMGGEEYVECYDGFERWSSVRLLADTWPQPCFNCILRLLGSFTQLLRRSQTFKTFSRGHVECIRPLHVGFLW
jgi:hypothetical protein